MAISENNCCKCLFILFLISFSIYIIQEVLSFFKFLYERKEKKNNLEEEYQKLLSESKDYNPFKDYDINKFILTLSQMNNIKNNINLKNKLKLI